jgi:hypothetical protein
MAILELYHIYTNLSHNLIFNLPEPKGKEEEKEEKRGKAKKKREEQDQKKKYTSTVHRRLL